VSEEKPKYIRKIRT